MHICVLLIHDLTVVVWEPVFFSIRSLNATALTLTFNLSLCLLFTGDFTHAEPLLRPLPDPAVHLATFGLIC